MKYTTGCYYCVCTACRSSACPWKHLLYRQCFVCQEKNLKSPRLRCDYFQHYLKIRKYRFKRGAPAAPGGSYILITKDSVFVGEYKKIKKLYDRLGGELRKYNVVTDWSDK